MFMKKRALGIVILGTNLVLAMHSHPTLAQSQSANGPTVVDNASGSSGACTVSGPANEQVVFCTDLTPGNGVSVVNPGAEAARATKEVPPAPAADPAPTAETTDTAVSTATDQDADNAPDDQEPGLGLDPTNPDTDGDGVADGDEPNIYGTDPLVWDTDGDGVSDGEELFGIFTDPLVWDDFTSGNTAP